MNDLKVMKLLRHRAEKAEKEVTGCVKLIATQETKLNELYEFLRKVDRCRPSVALDLVTAKVREIDEPTA